MSLLSLQSVTKSYWRGPRELRVLRGASLDVGAGTLVSVYGQRNSGKTALLEIAAGAVDEPHLLVVPDRDARLDALDQPCQRLGLGLR